MKHSTSMQHDTTTRRSAFANVSSWFATLLTGAVMLGFAAPAHASVIYDESTDGDLSNAYYEPTELDALTPVSNKVTGSSGYVELGGDDFPEGDNALFVVPAGGEVFSIDLWVDRQTAVRLYNVDGSGNTSWPAFAEDDAITAAHTHLLEYFELGDLGPGEYVITLFNNSGDTSSTLNYTYDLNMAPSPATLPMLLLLGAPLLLRRQRRTANG